MKKFYFPLLGSVTGFVNGIFGSGGGVLSVPLLKKAGLDEKSSHATSLALTLPISTISVFLYGRNGSLPLPEILPFILPGLIGAIIGGVLLKKIPSKALKRIFGGVLLFAGFRMLLC